MFHKNDIALAVRRKVLRPLESHAVRFQGVKDIAKLLSGFRLKEPASIGLFILIEGCKRFVQINRSIR